MKITFVLVICSRKIAKKGIIPTFGIFVEPNPEYIFFPAKVFLRIVQSFTDFSSSL